MAETNWTPQSVTNDTTWAKDTVTNDTTWATQSVTNDTSWTNPIQYYGFLTQSGTSSSFYLLQSNGDKLYITRKP